MVLVFHFDFPANFLFTKFELFAKQFKFQVSRITLWKPSADRPNTTDKLFTLDHKVFLWIMSFLFL